MKPVIALDADGVLLDYNAAYREAWERAFGVRPRLVNPNAYWAIDRWGVERLAGEELERLREAFDDSHWSSIPALPGALNACKQLVLAGFELVCVTAINASFLDARRRNICDLGFPVKEVIATGGTASTASPKSIALTQLAPVAFVDDYLPYHRGLPTAVHKALIMRDPDGSPNAGDELSIVDSQHSDLQAFADWWVLRSVRNTSRA